MSLSEEHKGVTFSGGLPFRYTEVKDFDRENGCFLYARGFLVCQSRDLIITPFFSCYELSNNYWLYCHNMLQVDIAGDRTKQAVILLGLGLFSSEQYDCYGKNEAEVLLEEYQKGGSEAFREAITYLGGRWAIILIDKGCIKVYNDACGLKPVYYCREAKAFGSHIDLVNKVAKAPESNLWQHCKKLKYVFTYSYIGRHTPFDGIEMLIPNFYLNLNDYREIRFYPYKKRQIADNLAQVKEEFFKALQVQMKALTSKGGNVCLSLTGGLDSRVSYYAIRDYKDKIFFFTEDRDDDLEKSEAMAVREKLNWLGSDSKDLHYEQNDIYKAFMKCITERVFPFNARYTLRNYFFNFLMFGENNFVHIHSNGAEAARGRFESVVYDFAPEEYEFERFLDIYISSTFRYQNREICDYQKKTMSKDELVVKEVKDFFNFLNHDSLKDLGYNPWDFMYIEQRMATFLAQVHMLNDAAFESFSLTNCRAVLDILWQVPDKYINSSSLLFKVIVNEYDQRDRQMHMGKNFKSKPTDLQGKNYAMIFGGDVLLESINSIEEKYKLLKAVLKENSTVKWAYEKIVNIAIKMGLYQDAFKYAEDMIDYDETLAGHWSLDALCNELRKKEEWKEKVIELLKKILSKNNNIAWANRQLGQLLFASDKEKGVLLCEKAYRLEPKNWVMAQVYLNLLKDSNRQEEFSKLLDGEMKVFSNMNWYKEYKEKLKNKKDQSPYAQNAKKK